MTLVNHASRLREFDLTSYTEVCLNNRRTDQAHPAFVKLFLETEFMHDSSALCARRRPQRADEKPVWAIHVTAADGGVEYETDRARFLGRGRTPANPAALDTGSHLSGTTGSVLDPIFCLRRRVRLAAGGMARVAFVTGAAETHEAATALAEHFREVDAADRAFDLARRSGPKELRELNLTPDDICHFQSPGRGGGLHWPRAAPARRRRRQPLGAAGPVAARHFRRPPHRVGTCHYGR